MHYDTAINIRAATLRAADALTCTLGAHAPESVPAEVRAALQHAIDAALAVLDAVDAATGEG